MKSSAKITGKREVIASINKWLMKFKRRPSCIQLK